MIYNIIIVIVLVILSGCFAGLTLALFSLQLTDLERKVKLGNLQAKKLYPIRKKGNLLLCTLLLGNVASYTVMAIYLTEVSNGVFAGFVATALIFIFGEILPQAIFPRFALQISVKFIWLIWLSLIIFYPVAAPIAWILNKLLGYEPPVLWSKRELEEIIKYHEDYGDGIIDEDEERIILGALSFSDKHATDIMIPKKDVFYLYEHTSLSKPVINKIIRKGYSRIPIVDKKKNQVIGLLFSKDLIGFTPSIKVTVNDLYEKDKVIVERDSIQLDTLLNILIHQKLHMALLTDSNDNFTGVATLEDIIEEIIKTDLEDYRSRLSE